MTKSHSLRIEKLKMINVKLRNKLKELNQLLEKTLEKANTRKIYKNKDQKQQDVGHMIEVKKKELKNSQNQIEIYRKEIANLQAKIE